MLACDSLALVRITNISEVEKFARHHSDAAKHIRRWRDRVLDARWESPHDLDREMTGVRRIRNRRLIFKIKGNDYRVVAVVNYELGTLRIRFWGTHAEYDKIEAEEV